MAQFPPKAVFSFYLFAYLSTTDGTRARITSAPSCSGAACIHHVGKDKGGCFYMSIKSARVGQSLKEDENYMKKIISFWTSYFSLILAFYLLRSISRLFLLSGKRAKILFPRLQAKALPHLLVCEAHDLLNRLRHSLSALTKMPSPSAFPFFFFFFFSISNSYS